MGHRGIVWDVDEMWDVEGGVSGVEGCWCRLVVLKWDVECGLWFPYISIRIFSRLGGPALMFPEVV